MCTPRSLVGRPVILLIVASLVLLSGCGEDNPLGRRSVSGSVSFQGKPLQNGAIRFEPDDAAKGVGGGAAITDGKYFIEEGSGLPPGTYKVWITASGTGTLAPVDVAPGETPRSALAKELIPPQYNVQTELVAEVAATGETVFDFHLK